MTALAFTPSFRKKSSATVPLRHSCHTQGSRSPLQRWNRKRKRKTCRPEKKGLSGGSVPVGADGAARVWCSSPCSTHCRSETRQHAGKRRQRCSRRPRTGSHCTRSSGGNTITAVAYPIPSK